MNILFKKNTEEEDQIRNVLIRISIVCCTGIAIATIYGKPNIASVLFYTSFFTNIIAFVMCIQDKPLEKNTEFVVKLLLLIFAVGIISITSFKISFEYIKKYVIYITALSSYFVAIMVTPSKKTVMTLLTCNFILAILYVTRSQTPGAYVGETLWLYFSNPNFAAMWLNMTAMYLVVTVVFLKKKALKIIVILLTIYLMKLCYETGARNVTLSAIYTVFLLTYCIFSGKKRFSKRMTIILNLFPLVFAFAYILILKNVGFSGWILEKTVQSGKTVNSRYSIWLEALKYIRAYPIFGAYRYISSKIGVFQFHNTHMDIWASYGTTGLILFLVYIHKIIQYVNGNSSGTKSMLALAGFIIMLLMGTGEGGLYAGGMGMHIYVSSFLLLSKYFEECKEE